MISVIGCTMSRICSDNLSSAAGFSSRPAWAMALFVRDIFPPESPM